MTRIYKNHRILKNWLKLKFAQNLLMY